MKICSLPERMKFVTDDFKENQCKDFSANFDSILNQLFSNPYNKDVTK